MPSQIQIPQGHTATVPIQYTPPGGVAGPLPAGDTLSAGSSNNGYAHPVVSGTNINVVGVAVGNNFTISVSDSIGSVGDTFTVDVIAPPPGTLVPNIAGVTIS